MTSPEGTASKGKTGDGRDKDDLKEELWFERPPVAFKMSSKIKSPSQETVFPVAVWVGPGGSTPPFFM